MNATDLTTSPDCLLNYNHYDVICYVINVYIYRKLAPPSENRRSAPENRRNVASSSCSRGHATGSSVTVPPTIACNSFIIAPVENNWSNTEPS